MNVANILGARVNRGGAVTSPPGVVFRRVIGGEAGEVGLHRADRQTNKSERKYEMQK